MTAASSSAVPAGDVRNPSEPDSRRANLQNAKSVLHHLPGNVASLAHMDGTVRQIQTKILGDLVHWFDKTFGFIMVAQNLGSTAACLGWVILTSSHNRVNTELGLPENDHRLSTMWFMGSSIGFLLVGRLSDLYGRRYFIIGTSFLGVIGCILGRFGGSTNVLTAANVLNGVAAAAQMSFGFFVATLLGPFVTAPISAAITSYVLLDSTSRWRWNYGLGFGCAFLSAWVYFLCYFPPSCKQLNVDGGTRLQMAKNLDIVGIFLFVSGCVLTMTGLSWVGAEYTWESKEVLSMLLGGFASFVTFFVYEAFFCRVPALMPPKLFKNRYYFSLVTNAFFSSMAYFVVYVFWPSVVGKVFGGNPYYVAWQIGCLGSMKTDRYAQITASAGLLCFAIGFIENVALTGVTYIWEAQDIGLAFGVLGCICSLGCAFAQVGFVSILD
ncbi:trichothecene efflux pump [Colletotrichum incanum]|uniref:Trichothecene efflux pump n=1 Tax=Colletotrichum incanum TaxID=1573173 RepID=A0A167BA89_COLIC|nr:trichothecene efflux pump [Colletotrichum incanum]